MNKKIVIYFLNRKRENAEKLFYELIGKELLKNNPIVKFVKSYCGKDAMFEDGTSIRMHRAAESARGLRWTTAYIDCDTDPEIIQCVLIPSGKCSKDIHYFN